jgi:hypothetical protein
MSIHRRRSLVAAVLALGATMVLSSSACREKGPAEKAGEKVDKAIDKAEDALNPKGPAEKAGRKIDRALDH